MKVLLVYAHPEPRSLNGALRDVAVKALEAEGHEVRITDLYAEGWKSEIDRADFPALARHVYLNAAAGSITPKWVREAVMRYQVELEEGGDDHWDLWLAQMEVVRERVARDLAPEIQIELVVWISIQQMLHRLGHYLGTSITTSAW